MPISLTGALTAAVTLPFQLVRALTDLPRLLEQQTRLTDEVLRWDPPGRVVTRVAAADTELGGRALPAGQVVHALLGAAVHARRG